jgi:transcriptional regulator with XRE-family HTH domain
VNVEQAAEKLRTTKTAVREVIKGANAKLSNTFYRAVSGRRDADVGERTNTKGMLQAAYGKGPRGGAVDVKAAAKALGVSPSTVRRWAAGTQQPTAEHLKSLQAASRKASTTKAGRRRATDNFRTSAQGRNALDSGARIQISGFQGVSEY